MIVHVALQMHFLEYYKLYVFILIQQLEAIRPL